MAAGIQIEIRKVGRPAPNVLKQRAEQGHVVSIVPPHQCPSLDLASHTAEPEVFPGVWELTPDAKEPAGGVKLVAIQAELLPENLQRVDGSIRRWWLEVMIEKAGVGFFEVECVAIVCDGYVTGAKQLMELFNESSILVEGLSTVTRVIRQSPYYDFLVAGPLVSE